MKLKNVSKCGLLALALLVATTAFAINKGSLHIQEAVEVNGQQIPAGDYQLRWEGTGPNVELSFMQGKKEVAKTSARVVQLNETQVYDSAVVDHSSGKAVVSEIRFSGKKSALAIGSSDRASMSSTN